MFEIDVFFLRISDITKEFTEKCILLEYLPSFDISTPPMQCSSSAETAEPIRQNYCQSYSYSTATEDASLLNIYHHLTSQMG